jgi:hypothetical protein
VSENTIPAPGENLDIPREMLEAKRHGKGYVQIISEAFSLSRGPGRISFNEYLYYKLWKLEKQDQLAFLGKKSWKTIFERCCDMRYNILFHDKLYCYALLDKFGIPAPRVRAVCDPIRKYDSEVCRNEDELRLFLKNCDYPIFAKPITGMYSMGAARLDACDGHTVKTHDQELPLDEFVKNKNGYVFQEVVRPHAEIKHISGGLATLRLIVLLDKQPELLYSLWKIPVGDNVADNFWRGNLLGFVENGSVTRVITRDRIEVDRHPTSGAPLLIDLPDFEKAVELAFRCAPFFPMTRLQAYDLALTRDGPSVIEINVGGDFDLPQLASAVGFLSGRFKEFLDSGS